MLQKHKAQQLVPQIAFLSLKKSLEPVGTVESLWILSVIFTSRSLCSQYPGYAGIRKSVLTVSKLF